MFKDINELLDRIPKWKKIQETPEKIAALEERVAALEKRLEKIPGEGCPACGERKMRRTWASDSRGPFPNVHRNETWTCEGCGAQVSKTVKAS